MPFDEAKISQQRQDIEIPPCLLLTCKSPMVFVYSSLLTNNCENAIRAHNQGDATLHQEAEKRFELST
jgi:hypothetical protein